MFFFVVLLPNVIVYEEKQRSEKPIISAVNFRKSVIFFNN